MKTNRSAGWFRGFIGSVAIATIAVAVYWASAPVAARINEINARQAAEQTASPVSVNLSDLIAAASR